ncbi:XPG I [Methanococcus vannielii SB]|uniref:Flap endonuclease 1 n=1 Tax=Methanococcus vannielii (strain ATCC 35089 / DSM 1224 / JCM 13029 / OCM 148 / SB) TaxID=406327 RepID=A6UPV7_METVS|nr:flap endonuclease-1 [Methanococcus vannielii]ABR54529.1 XPG I [Methanococcus vannielii SB]
MGVQFGDIIPKKEISLKLLRTKSAAIDAMNVIYQFLSSIRLKDGSPLKNRSGEITSTYNGIFYKTIYMLENEITPIWVFDGKSHDLKEKTKEDRRKLRQNALENYLEAKEQDNLENMQKYAKRANFLDKKTIENSKRLLELMGVPYINAPSEGEAQCAELVKSKNASFVVSQDYDSILYGAESVVKNITSSNKSLELIELSKVLTELNVNLLELIDVAILIGTDYNPGGIKGIGPKKAFEVVKKGQMEKYAFEIQNYSEIRKIFDEPNVITDYEIGLKLPRKDELIEFLVEENDFSKERVLPNIEKLDLLLGNKKSQKSLESWF